MAYTGSRLADIETNVQLLANDASANFLSRTQFIALCNMCLRELGRRNVFTRRSDIDTVIDQESYALSTTLSRVAYFTGGAATNLGAGRVGLPATLHGFVEGDTIQVIGTTNYNGSYVLQSQTTTNLLAIVALYIAESPAVTAYAKGLSVYGRVINITYNTEEVPMTSIGSWVEFNELRQYTTLGVPDVPVAWIFMPEENDLLYIWPKPTVAVTGGLHIVHTWVPAAFSESYNYTPPTPVMYDDLYMHYVLWKRFGRDYATSQAQPKQSEHQQEFETLIRDLKRGRSHQKRGFVSYR